MKRKTLTLKKKEAPKDQDTASESQDTQEDEPQNDTQQWSSEGGSLGPPALDEGEE